MDSLDGKTAVITGAASGIGLALAHALARAGCNVVLTDIDEVELTAVEPQFHGSGRLVVTRVLDVSRGLSLDELADWVWSELGGAHILCNNAGVNGFRGGALWDATDADWAWTMGVNFWGVVNGTRAFLPRMLASKQPGHIVNTVSTAALTQPNNMYGVSKHAVLAFTEAVHAQLTTMDAVVGVTALLPDLTSTPFFARDHRPDDGEEAARDRHVGAAIRSANDALLRREGVPPDVVAARAVAAIRAKDLYALTHETSKEYIRTRANLLLGGLSEPFDGFGE